MVSLSLIALIAGACSIPCGFLAMTGYGVFASLALVIAGFVLGALGMMREKDKSGLALIGLACSLIGLIITVACFACAGCAVCRYASLAESIV